MLLPYHRVHMLLKTNLQPFATSSWSCLRVAKLWHHQGLIIGLLAKQIWRWSRSIYHTSICPQGYNSTQSGPSLDSDCFICSNIEQSTPSHWDCPATIIYAGFMTRFRVVDRRVFFAKSMGRLGALLLHDMSKDTAFCQQQMLVNRWVCCVVLNVQD